MSFATTQLNCSDFLGEVSRLNKFNIKSRSQLRSVTVLSGSRSHATLSTLDQIILLAKGVLHFSERSSDVYLRLIVIKVNLLNASK